MIRAVVGGVGVVAFGLGVVVGKFDPGAFSPALPLGDVVNALATIAVGVLIGFLFHKHHSTARFERELVVRLCTDAMESLGDIEGSFRRVAASGKLGENDKSTLLELLTRYSNRLHSVDSALVTAKIQVSKSLQAARDKNEELRKAITEPAVKESAYDKAEQKEVGKFLKECRDALIDLMLEINRS